MPNVVSYIYDIIKQIPFDTKIEDKKHELMRIFVIEGGWAVGWCYSWCKYVIIGDHLWRVRMWHYESGQRVVYRITSLPSVLRKIRITCLQCRRLNAISPAAWFLATTMSVGDRGNCQEPIRAEQRIGTFLAIMCMQSNHSVFRYGRRF